MLKHIKIEGKSVKAIYSDENGRETEVCVSAATDRGAEAIKRSWEECSKEQGLGRPW